MPRYVILQHETPEGYPRPTHWDLMFESGDVLKTWALDEEPGEGGRIEAEQLADHRKEYLDYEGPVSGDRGTVSQWTTGDYTTVRHSDDEFAARLDSGQLIGTVVARRIDDQRWMVSFSSESTVAVCNTPDAPDDASTPSTSPDR